MLRVDLLRESTETKQTKPNDDAKLHVHTDDDHDDEYSAQSKVTYLDER